MMLHKIPQVWVWTSNSTGSDLFTTSSPTSAITNTTVSNTLTSTGSITQNVLFTTNPAIPQENVEISNWKDLSAAELWYYLLNACKHKLIIPPQRDELTLEMPDGAILRIKDRSYRIEDENCKVIYKANRNREFNPYVNASEMLANFLLYLNTLDLQIGKAEILQLPVELFIQWLVIEAARADDEPLNPEEVTHFDQALKAKLVPLDKVPAGAVPLLPQVQPRCPCGRFLAKARYQRGILFCSGEHMDRYEERILMRAA